MNLELIHPVSLASLLRAPSISPCHALGHRRMQVIRTLVHTEVVPQAQYGSQKDQSLRSAALLRLPAVPQSGGPVCLPNSAHFRPLGP